ncbi:hypothetical protein ABEB36_011817 [Hypothenemus hampei]|uniref:Uncharacterized protein n=1 Tax=Hypothenemus hampei TaxID=57062 RepID=A0ABD1EB57_HYPHA
METDLKDLENEIQDFQRKIVTVKEQLVETEMKTLKQRIVSNFNRQASNDLDEFMSIYASNLLKKHQETQCKTEKLKSETETHLCPVKQYEEVKKQIEDFENYFKTMDTKLKQNVQKKIMLTCDEFDLLLESYHKECAKEESSKEDINIEEQLKSTVHNLEEEIEELQSKINNFP